MERAAFLDRLRRRLDGGIPANPAHPLPPPPPDVPEAVPRSLDRDDLLGSFERAASAVHAHVHRIDLPDVPLSLLAELVDRAGVRRACVSREPEALAVGARLATLGVEVEEPSLAAATRADLGVTSAVAAIAATGSIVLDSARAGGRTLWLLPPTHLAVLPVDRLVATPGDVLRRLGTQGPLSANLCVVTGPSRSGDIEQIIVEGVHGPTAVHVALLGA
ncbi:MAG: LUD domain-containing protein [Acidimicrobiales bacterium]|nr:LUD domain-containing protein [Acidimicrobiales bacterium]